jgi:hypothetical protein
MDILKRDEKDRTIPPTKPGVQDKGKRGTRRETERRKVKKDEAEAA